MTQLRITGGAIHDPANGIDGDVRDICVDGGRIVASLAGDAPVLEANGMVVMAGGIDIHAHVASSSVTLGRRLLPDEHSLDPARAPALEDGTIPRSGSGGTVPSTFTTGYRYAGLGYTTVFDAAVAPVSARQTHAEFDDTPIIDGGFFALLGNDEYLHRQIAANETRRAKDYAAWILKSTGGYAIKVVNPGGVELWKRNVREVKTLDDPVGAAERDAATNSRSARRCGDRARPSAPRAHSLQQPRRRRERRDDARHHACARRSPGAFHAPAVPQLRW